MRVKAPNFGGRRGVVLSADEQKRLQQGSDIFGGVCFTCHGSDGLGQPLAGAPPGTSMAPALAGSPRVQGHRDYVIKVLLNGLSGPVGGKTYSEVMVPMGAGSSDEWVAAIASYIRTSFGNNAGLVTPEDVARVRKATADRRDLWTVDEIEATLPRLVDARQLTLTASHNAEAAGGAATLRGWSSGAPQAPGMGFQSERPRPARVPALQVESGAAPSPGGRAGRGGRGGFGGPPPVIAFPRAYSVQTSTDGSTWSQPVAAGKGTGARTTIAFAPTRAKFVRITETEAVENAPVWSIANLRVYEAAGGGGTR